jgi:hypothetical protein
MPCIQSGALVQRDEPLGMQTQTGSGQLRIPVKQERPRWQSLEASYGFGTTRAGGLLAAAGRVVLVHHTGGNAPPLAHRHAMLLRPRPDVARALAAGGPVLIHLGVW